MPVPKTILKKAVEEYSKYGIDDKTPVSKLQEGLLNVCYMVANDKKSFIKCLDEGAKMVRKKIRQIRDAWSDRLKEPVNEDVVEELIEELNGVKSPDGTGLGDIKRPLILACANVSETVGDLLTCIDEGEKIPLLINKDLAKYI